MSTPGVSIITINFNNAAGLKKTIESVLSQVAGDYEFIVIDGGSTDGSGDLIEKYRSEIAYWVSEKDNGIYYAMNKGIKAAKGKFLLFLNSGDYLLDETVLQNVNKQLDDSGIVYGDLIMQDENGTQRLEVSPDIIDLEHLIVSTVWHPSAFIQKKIFEKFGYYDESYQIASDYAFFVSAILKNRVSTKHMHITTTVFEMNGLSNSPKHFNLMLSERKKAQAALFNPGQLKQLELFEIKTAGRNSRFFRFVPDFAFIQKLYDKFYYHWYKWRMS